jgi:hypothetical protein
MAFKSPLTSTTEFGLMKVGTNLTVTDGTVSATGGLPNDSYYGKFFSDANQTNTAINTALAMSFPNTTLNNGITTAGTVITFVNAGVYTIIYETQAGITSGGGGDIDIWAIVDGVPLPNSNAITTIPGGGNNLIINRSFLVNLTAGQTMGIQWSSAIANMQLTALGTQVGPTRPATNSANFLATLVRVL